MDFAGIGATIDSIAGYVLIAIALAVLLRFFKTPTKGGLPTGADPYVGPALTTCPVCDETVSAKAAKCPHCGQPLRKHD
jgi:hypothetical protein